MWWLNIGPFSLDERSLETDPPTLFRSGSSWTSVANVLFWESPAGVGFSFCEGGCPGYTDETVAVDNAEFICAFYRAYPEFAGQGLYIAGESYAGVYIPTAALEYLERGCQGGPEAPLLGVAIGNGCTGTDVGTCSTAPDEGNRAVYSVSYLQSIGFMSAEVSSIIDTECEGSAGYSQASPECAAALQRASDEVGAFNQYNAFDTCLKRTTLIQMVCGFVPGAESWACPAAGFENRASAFGALLSEPADSGERARQLGTTPESYQCGGDDATRAYLSRTDVQQAIHTYNVTGTPTDWPGSGISYTRSAKDLLHPSAEYPYSYPLLVNKTRVLIYSGDFDVQIPHIGTEKWTSELGYPVLHPWRTWKNGGGATVGNIIEYNTPVDGTQFAFVTVRGAGHEVPAYKQEAALTMIERFIKGEPL